MDISPLTEEEKVIYRARLKHSMFRELRSLYIRLNKENGLTYKDVADRLMIDEELVSKRLSGNVSMTLNNMCDMARAMGARLDVSVLYPISTTTTTTTG